MLYMYECEVYESGEGGYLAKLFDFGRMTQGDDFKDAIRMAADLLRVMVEEYLAYGKELPDATYDHTVESGGRLVVVTAEVTLRASEEFVSATEAATYLGVTRPRISHLLADRKLVGYKEKGNTFVSLPSLEEYRNTPRKAGRPREVVTQ